MEFKDFVCFEAVIPHMKAETRDEAIEELVTSLAEAGKLKKTECKSIIKAIIKRENEASTGMGKGVAVPHAKYDKTDHVIAVVGQSDEGIDFSSLDKQPVYIIFLLISPTGNPEVHLQAMEKVFKHLQQEKFRKFLKQCRDQHKLQDLLHEADDDPGLFL